ncbi:chemotaxis-specific protein-glutamate methyltransferase CheB [bacterium]|nr:chemotaxis-specific protein-glutamate methyltransferase CheB [bacterium]
MIKVLITEDSPVVRGYLKYIFESDPDIQVVGTAEDGEKAVEMVKLHQPDVVTMDIHMPKMDGFQATRKIMETNPVPIIICSASWNPEEVEKTFKTMEAGAVAALEKPRGMGHPDSQESVQELIKTVKLMSGVRVVRRWSKGRGVRHGGEAPVVRTVEVPGDRRDIRLVAVGASTGGPLVLQTLLSGLPRNFPVPIAIVQHIAPGFLSGLGEWLTRTTGFPVHIASQGEHLQSGHAYLAPDGFQMSLDKSFKTLLSGNTKEYTLCPSVSYFFKSLIPVFRDKMAGVLLTGMGRDGADELKLMKDAGALTIAQDKETSVVHGMPGEAIKIGGAVFVLPSDKIAGKIVHLVKGAAGA